MNLELVNRIHKELSITGSAVYEAILAVSERVNRKVQVIRLHWQASTLSQQVEQHTAELGQQIVEHVSRRFLGTGENNPIIPALDSALVQATTHIHGLKQSLMQIDAQIRELHLEAIHEDLLRFQQDLSLRSAGIERLSVARHASAVGQPLRVLPRGSSVHVATVLRGPFLLPPSDDLVFRPDDVVVLIGTQPELDQFVTYFTSQDPVKTPRTKSA